MSDSGTETPWGLAAAILVALPDGWCGHGTTPQMAPPPGAAEMARWMAQWNAEHGGQIIPDTIRKDAEIARLRAALEIIAAEPDRGALSDAIGITARNIARHALRAALGELP